MFAEVTATAAWVDAASFEVTATPLGVTEMADMKLADVAAGVTGEVLRVRGEAAGVRGDELRVRGDA
jgi:hypothetical protein